ncbi:glycosyltransferase family 4 protein [Halomonas sp. MC140]|nr:glycosyltransferase family 4 protein [Halomonas sp. MC140]MDN7132016.1 glycosyltransferase family 4 protein [Halomonas sp. MC140]
MEDTPMAVIAIRKLNKTTGAARIALQQISILRDIGYHVTVICEEANEKTICLYGGHLKKMMALPFGKLMRRKWFSRRANHWCQRHNPSLIISHGDIENSDIIYMHNCVDLAQEIIYPNSVRRQSDVSKIHQKILKESHYKNIVANSHLMARDLINRYTIPSHKLRVSHPGFDAQKFNASVQSRFRKTQRKELGISDSEKLVGLITSGDFEKRNLELFIEIAGQLTKQSDLSYHFLVIGQGNINIYKEKVAVLGIENYFTWKKMVPNVEHYYSALDLFVLPAHIEEFGCAILEAMACSTLTLMSERVGAGEILLGDLKSLIVKGYDLKHWAEKIDNMMKNDNRYLRSQLIETANQYTYDYQYKALQDIIAEHLQKKTKGDL